MFQQPEPYCPPHLQSYTPEPLPTPLNSGRTNSYFISSSNPFGDSLSMSMQSSLPPRNGSPPPPHPRFAQPQQYSSGSETFAARQNSVINGGIRTLHTLNLSNEFPSMAPTTTTTTGVGQMNDPRRGYLASPNNSFDQSLRLGQTTRPPVLHHTSFPTSSGRLGVSAHPPPVDGPFSGGTGFGQSNSLSPLGSDPWSTSSSKAPVYTPPRQPSLLSHSFDSHNEFIIPRIEDPSIGNVSLAASSSNVSRNPSARPGSSSSSDSAVHSQLRQSTGNGSSSSSSSNGLFIYDTHAPSLRTFQLTTPSAPPSPTPNPAQQSHSSVSPAKPHACKTCGATFQRGHDLSRHIKSHDHPRYYCQGCGKVYSRQDSVRRHVARAKCAGGDVRIGGKDMSPCEGGLQVGTIGEGGYD